ncbi:acyl-CoA dehydrogenase family protein [Actinomadura macra]|uniref:acyl-CoA dehydrogenase family protein n=1 Tax=Actinomadura macra TaxID=46164 RepID=UPI00082E2A1B|nr:acyl-CoA dehydrogenase family protein [Actinomadura macra]
MKYQPYALTERLEERFGDPGDAVRTFSLARCAELDRREEFPADICRALDEAGVAGYYVPARFGGAVHTFEDTLQVVRLMARRDLTVAIGHGKTFLGGVSAWVGAEPDQARRIAAEVLGGSVVSWGLTEEAHGSDLLAGEVTAAPVAGGYRVAGEKWLINNATRADLVCLLARTDPDGGPRGFSLLLMDKHRLGPDAYRCLPKVRTHGVRGADISGIGFDGAMVEAGDLLGAPGSGVETVLKGLQLTRTLVAGLSLGAADRALRLCTGFALGHELYGRRLVDLPHAARTLTESYTDLLTAEVLSLVATRAIHALPGELSVLSAVVKYHVPTSVDALIASLGQTMGARAFLATENDHGLFQKVERDHRIVGIFDGNTLVNLNVVINHFPVLARMFARERADEPAVAAAAGVGEAPPEFAPDRLELVSRTGCSLLQGLPAAVAALPTGTPPAVAALARRLRDIAADVHERMAGHRPTARSVPGESFDLAREYTLCVTGAACLWFWLHNRERAGAEEPTAELWADALWLEASLTRLLGRLRPGAPTEHGATDHGAGDHGAGEPGGAVYDRLLPALLAQYRAGLLFSPLLCRLPEERP